MFVSWKGLKNDPAGGQRTIVELTLRWRKGQTLEPDWQIDQDGWVIEVAGRPTVTMKVGFLPPPDFEATTLEEFMVLGHIMTATPPAERDPGRRRGGTGHRHLQRPAVDPAARSGPDVSA